MHDGRRGKKHLLLIHLRRGEERGRGRETHLFQGGGAAREKILFFCAGGRGEMKERRKEWKGGGWRKGIKYEKGSTKPKSCIKSSQNLRISHSFTSETSFFFPYFLSGRMLSAPIPFFFGGGRRAQNFFFPHPLSALITVLVMLQRSTGSAVQLIVSRKLCGEWGWGGVGVRRDATTM